MIIIYEARTHSFRSKTQPIDSAGKKKQYNLRSVPASSIDRIDTGRATITLELWWIARAIGRQRDQIGLVVAPA